MTISIETGVQSFALAMAIVTLSFDEDDEDFDDAIVVPLLCACLYAFHCGWIVLVFRWLGPDPEATDEAVTAAPGEAAEETKDLEDGAKTAAVVEVSMFTQTKTDELEREVKCADPTYPS